MIKTLLSISMPLFLAFSAFAQQSHEKLVRETDYLLYLPEGYKEQIDKQFPLVMYLHGSGESGSDLERVKGNGLPKLVAQGKEFPFILISPQTDNLGWNEDELYRLLQRTKQSYRVDTNRIYLTGISMGGAGTWSMAIKYPELFAAIAPIAGGRDTANLFRLRNMAVWAFHGFKDDVAPPKRSIEMVDILRRFCSNVRLTLYPQANHNSWDTTYNNPKFYTWLLNQRKFLYQPVKVKQKILNTYAGKYAGPYDTVEVLVEKGHLILKPRPDRFIEMKAASDTKFYVRAWEPVDAEFIINSKEQLCILNRQARMVYKKIR
ncbi:Phospholipase/Carboxylesterase [Mucilaginibacter pineti]|uniref:Phospholipase/Carboxylesterase n=1 Tax=Mucilaginibacter pineti TaxID=1391627 RepID=A0A1G7EKH6_9SPHI|nr:PHB depolymerase family esterase [Mucilaginibacter pineti]SDE64164.1 Phospholipase/Carboxylesterase [Mucilaginibacter pineti]